MQNPPPKVQPYIRHSQPSETANIIRLYQNLPSFFTDRSINNIQNDLTRSADAQEEYYSIVAVDPSNNEVTGNLIFSKDPTGDRVYEFKWLAIKKSANGLGMKRYVKTFTNLMAHGEAMLAEKARLFILYTSNTDNERQTQTLFQKIGYERCAVVPDFWDQGDDRVIFIKKNSH